jgi:hypothetical protein
MVAAGIRVPPRRLVPQCCLLGHDRCHRIPDGGGIHDFRYGTSWSIGR